MRRKGQKAKHSRSRIHNAVLKGLCFDSEGEWYLFISIPRQRGDKGDEGLEIELRAATAAVWMYSIILHGEREN